MWQWYILLALTSPDRVTPSSFHSRNRRAQILMNQCALYLTFEQGQAKVKQLRITDKINCKTIVGRNFRSVTVTHWQNVIKYRYTNVFFLESVKHFVDIVSNDFIRILNCPHCTWINMSNHVHSKMKLKRYTSTNSCTTNRFRNLSKWH